MAGGPGGPGGGPGGRSDNQNQQQTREQRRQQRQSSQNSGGMARTVSYGSGGNPAQKRARIARQQFDRYMDRFAPIEDDLVDFTMDGAGLDEAVGEARDSVDTAFDSQREQVGRGLSRYGATRSSSEQASARRQNLLRRAAASDQATNTARRDVEDRRLSLLSGGLNSTNPRPNPDDY